MDAQLEKRPPYGLFFEENSAEREVVRLGPRVTFFLLKSGLYRGKPGPLQFYRVRFVNLSVEMKKNEHPNFGGPACSFFSISIHSK